MSYPIEASTCPYCHTRLAKAPIRKSKCPHCKEIIFPRTIAASKARVLATAHEAEEIEKENADIYLERDWKRFLSSYQITDKDFEKERLNLKKKFGCDPKTSDVIWGLLQDLTTEAAKSGDFHRLKMAYLNQKRFLLDEGRNASKVTIEALKCEIYEGLQNWDNPQFQVMACRESCHHCKGYDGRIVDGKSAFGLIEEIVNGCTDARGCRCCLTVWRERWKDLLEESKTFPGKGKGSQVKKCPFCAEEIQDEAIKCRFCNNDLTPKLAVKKSSGCGTAFLITSLVVGGFIFFLVVLINILNYRDSKDAPATTSSGTASGAVASPQEKQAAALEKPTEPADSFGDGIYEVGREIQPGKYKTTGPAPGAFGCYYARLKGLSAEFDDIIANEIAQGPAAVTIKASDKAFKTQGCSTWMKFGNK